MRRLALLLFAVVACAMGAARGVAAAVEGAVRDFGEIWAKPRRSARVRHRAATLLALFPANTLTRPLFSSVGTGAVDASVSWTATTAAVETTAAAETAATTGAAAGAATAISTSVVATVRRDDSFMGTPSKRFT